MSTRLNRIATIVASLLIISLYAYRRILQVTHIQAHVGEHVAAVLRENAKPGFNPDKYADDIPLIWPDGDQSNQVFDFLYADPAGYISFPHAKVIWMKQYAGIVTAITVSGSVQKATLPKVYEEFMSSVSDLRKAGWAAKYDIPSLKQVQAEVTQDNGTRTAIGLTTFTKDGTEALLELASPGNSITPSSVNSSNFVLNVSFKNQTLDDEQGKKTYLERLRVKGNVNDYLPLSYWLEKEP